MPFHITRRRRFSLLRARRQSRLARVLPPLMRSDAPRFTIPPARGKRRAWRGRLARAEPFAGEIMRVRDGLRLLVLCVFLAGPGARAAPEPIRIGIITSLSGRRREREDEAHRARA